MRACPLLTAAILLAACQHRNEPDVVNIVTYRCGELEVSAVFRGEDSVELEVAGKSLTLPLAVSASGARYADAAGNEFWTKGLANGLLTLAGQARRSCAAPSTAARDSAPQ